MYKHIISVNLDIDIQSEWLGKALKKPIESSKNVAKKKPMGDHSFPKK